MRGNMSAEFLWGTCGVLERGEVMGFIAAFFHVIPGKIINVYEFIN